MHSSHSSSRSLQIVPTANAFVSAQSPIISDKSLPRADVPGLYVHVPFCFHKCHYCDFYSITRQTPQRMERYVELILEEAAGWGEGRRGPVVRPRTVFIGGGTPSLLPLEAMARLLSGLRERFDFAELEEWTVECNPATVSREYCAMLRAHGVDRLSLGAQSFAPAELRTLERHHDPEDVPRSLALAREAGFARLNLDLIYAIPGQDLGSWSRSLEATIALGTEHISCYALTYEANTPMAVKRRLGMVRAAEESLELEMMHYTRRRLGQAGYEAYEISNYCLREGGERGREEEGERGRGGEGETRRQGDKERRSEEATKRRSDEGEEERIGEPANRRTGDLALSTQHSALSLDPRPQTPDPSSPSSLSGSPLSAACRHNLLYWNGGSYIGLGPAGASHVEGWRWKNRPHLGEWEQAVGAGQLPAAELEHLLPEQRAGELVMLQLRLARGVRFDAFEAQSGVDARQRYRETLERLRRVGLIVVEASGFWLSESGLNVADAIAAEFL